MGVSALRAACVCGRGAGDESDEGLQDVVNMDVEYNVKGLVLSAYTEWGSNGGGKTITQ